jgi:uncharacterized protein DUF6072
MTGTAVSDTAPTTVEPTNASVFANGVKIVGEALIPGASLLMDGRLGNGAAHALVGLGARALLGPVGVVLVAADSYSKSVSGKYLWNHLGSVFDKTRDDLRKVEPASAPAESAAQDKSPRVKANS